MTGNRGFLPKRLLLLIGLALLAAECSAHAEEPFDYFANNWNVVGLKDYQRGARMTPDNRLMLADKAIVQIRFGRQLTPLSRAHGKRAMNGWMPVILVAAEDAPVRYDFTFWATPLPSAEDWRKAFDWPTEGENFLSWVLVRATNTSDQAVEAKVSMACSSTQQRPRAPEKPAEPKTGPLRDRDDVWTWQLPPGGTAQRAARFAFFPVEDPKTFDDEDAQVWLGRTVDYWRGLIGGAASIEVPCRKATEALRAAHVCQLIANDHGELHGGEGFYDCFYIRDGAYQVMELEEAGLMDAARKAIEFYLKGQRGDGRFETQKNQWDANGQAQWALWQFYKITGDREFLARAYPQMRRATQWTMQARRQAPADSPFAGVLPAAPADGECLWDGKYHIPGYDFWNLRGMLCTADAARALGKSEEADELLQEAAAYGKAIDATWKRTGLPHFPPSWEKPAPTGATRKRSGPPRSSRATIRVSPR